VLSSNSVTSYDKPAGATFTIANPVGTLASSSNNVLTSLFLSPSVDQKIMAFKLTASNDNVKLYDVVVTGTNLGALSNFRLENEDGSFSVPATSATTTGIKFTSISSAPSIAKDTSANYYIVADVNSSTETGGIAMTVDYTGTNIKGSNGATVQVTGSNVDSRTHATAENTLFVAKAENPNKGLTTSALRFTITADGKNSVTLTGLSINIAPSGYITTSGEIKVYKTSVSSSNLAGKLAYVGGDQTIVMTGNSSANSVVDAGTTAEYIVVLEGALVDSTASSTDWNVTLKDIMFGIFNATDYNNLGDLPITETK
ncbi:MAG: hypothetical protein GXP45_01225, partial [bacterium]|nr:hypothetical protein [bacterium]